MRSAYKKSSALIISARRTGRTRRSGGRRSTPDLEEAPTPIPLRQPFEPGDAAAPPSAGSSGGSSNPRGGCDENDTIVFQGGLRQPSGGQLTPVLQPPTACPAGVDGELAKHADKVASPVLGATSQDRYDASLSESHSVASSAVHSPGDDASGGAAAVALRNAATRAADRAALDRPLTADLNSAPKAVPVRTELARNVAKGAYSSPVEESDLEQRLSFGVGGKGNSQQKAGDGDTHAPSPFHRLKATFRQQRTEQRGSPDDDVAAADADAEEAVAADDSCGQMCRMSIPKLNLLNAMVPAKDGDPGAPHHLLSCPPYVAVEILVLECVPVVAGVLYVMYSIQYGGICNM